MLKNFLLKLFKPKNYAITRESIEYAYRLFFDRKPENIAAIFHHRNAKNLKELRNNFLHSDEFYFNHCKHFARRLFLEEMYAPKLNIDVDVDEEKLNLMILHIKKNWTEYGQKEPYWSVLTANDYTLKNISESREQFYNSGKEEVEGVVSILRRNDIDLNNLKSCLEYGCGVGRVTVWLATKFEHVFAFDISRSHLQIAEKYLHEKGLTNVNFLQVESLTEIQNPIKIDFLYSTLVLQHNPPPLIAYIIKKLLKLIKAKGVAIFQIPNYVKGYKFVASEYLKKIPINCEMEFHVLPQKNLFQIVEESGCSILEVVRHPATDDMNHVSNLFVIQKKTNVP